MADNKLALLTARYPHVVPVDPSLAPVNVQENHIHGYIDVAILALIVYSACYVTIFFQYASVNISWNIALSAVTNLDKEVCTIRILKVQPNQTFKGSLFLGNWLWNSIILVNTN